MQSSRWSVGALVLGGTLALAVGACGVARAPVHVTPSASTPTCSVAHVQLGLVSTPGGPGPSSVSWYVVINRGSQACVLDGHPKITFSPALPPGFGVGSDARPGHRVVLGPDGAASFAIIGGPPFASPFGGGSYITHENVTVFLPGASGGLRYSTTFNLSFQGFGTVGPVKSGYPSAAGSNPGPQPDTHHMIVLDTTVVPLP